MGTIGFLLKDLTGKPVVSPASSLNLKNQHHCVRAAHKTEWGYLFLLKKSMIFIPKPVVFIRYDEIERLEIVKGMSRARSFDITVHLVGKQAIEFGQIEFEEKDELKRFLQDVGVRLDDTDRT